MGVDSAFDAATQDNWSASHDMFARRIRRDPLHCNDRMPMAHVAQRLPAGFDGAELFLRVAR